MKMDFSTISQRIADNHGDRLAVVNTERGRSYTYREFHALTNRIVNMMRSKLKLGRGDRWFNILENDNLSLLHYFTACKSEAAACYTNYRDDLAQHIAQLRQIRPKVVFMENELLERYYQPLREEGIQIVCMDPLEGDWPEVLCFWDLLEGVSDENPGVLSDDRGDEVVLRFTGGTTGNSKCAAYSIGNWMHLTYGFFVLPELDWSDADRTLHLAPMSHGSGMLFMPMLFKGGCNYTMNKPDLVKWCRAVEKYRITTVLLVPTILYRLLEMPEASDCDLSSLHTAFYGASPISPAKLSLLMEKFGNVFVQIYAATEHPGLAIFMRRSHHLVDGENTERLASAGKTVPGVELIIADDSGAEVPRGERGEIWIRSPSGVCMGYFDNPKANEEEFENGFWKSGDIGRMDEEGFIYILDRKKDMIISGGFNVYATEVEAVLNAHPSILMSAVVGVPHPEWGEAVHAEVVLKEGETLAEAEIREYARATLGGYKTPKSVALVEALPLSAVGKVLRRKVREKYWAPGERAVG